MLVEKVHYSQPKSPKSLSYNLINFIILRSDQLLSRLTATAEILLLFFYQLKAISGASVVLSL